MNPLIPINQEGPYVNCEIAGQSVTCLGASRSALRSAEFPSVPLTTLSVNAVGISNQPVSHPVTKPLAVSLGPLANKHAFLLSPSSPVNLLGRDLLCKLGCAIYCTPDGVFLQVPDENTNLVLATLHIEEPAKLPTTRSPDLVHLLSQIPPHLWSPHANEVGQIPTAEPVKILVDPSKALPRVPQYPLRPEAEEGIAPVMESLLQQGISVATTSSCNTSIFPVKKPGKNTYRFVQDLLAINAVVLPSFPMVPNPATILSCIPPSATHFTVVDLCSDFFSIPIHPESPYLFAFTYKGRQYTWTRLPQGSTESPSLFSKILKKDLDGVVFPGKSVLIQYVDDLLLASLSFESCKADTLSLLTALAASKVCPVHQPWDFLIMLNPSLFSVMSVTGLLWLY
ncbi:uncharacterized protein LOC117888497 [Trachemys scripta elegans]|uniref:uncharacterized protein LOC117888497 n=1 Tax=Trachemys scripta elegans TaxID=31138 RepID=UPI00155625FC|nr:uncharacterized protein LOC117888497 [Trachemys scripta elegans]